MNVKLAEIAERITAHLKRFEADPVINAGRIFRDGEWTPSPTARGPFWQARSWPAGRFVSVCYVNYQGHSNLTRREAEEYLAWLDAGNVGKHHKVPRT